MRNSISGKLWLPLSSALMALTVSSAMAASTGFTAGNVVVWKSGDGAAALSTAASLITLDEYTPAGALVGTSFAFPTTGAGRLTIQGSTSTEGYQSLSANSRYIIVGGYDVDAGTLTPATDTTRVAKIGRVSVSDATVDLSTSLPGGTSTNDRGASNFRGYASNDGTGYYVATGGAGLRYIASGNSGAGNSVQIEGAASTPAAPTNMRLPLIYNGQLYASTMSGAYDGACTVGTGLPTTANQTVTQIISNGANAAVLGFAFETATRAWVADSASVANGGGAQQWDFSGSWSKTATYATAAGSLAANPLGLCLGKDASGNSMVFVTDSASSNNHLYSMSTTSPGTFTSLVAAGTNKVFRGVNYVNLIVNSVQTVNPNRINVTFNSSSMDTNVTVASNYTVSGAGQGTLATNPDSVALVSGGTYQLVWNSGSTVAGQPITITVNPTVQDTHLNTLASTANSGTDPSALAPVKMSRFMVE